MGPEEVRDFEHAFLSMTWLGKVKAAVKGAAWISLMIAYLSISCLRNKVGR